MPKYFFHVQDDDMEGTEYVDDAAARVAARETFGMLIKEGLDSGGAMRVVDANGRAIATLTYTVE
jgi:hypothetical protein